MNTLLNISTPFKLDHHNPLSININHRVLNKSSPVVKFNSTKMKIDGMVVGAEFWFP